MASAIHYLRKHQSQPDDEFLGLVWRNIEADYLHLLKLQKASDGAAKNISQSRERVETSRALLRQIAHRFDDLTDYKVQGTIRSCALGLTAPPDASGAC
jgi:hypothetical protein